MVDVLRDLSTVLANLPDNNAGLITPQDVRELVWSLAPDTIGVSLDPPVPVTVPVPEDPTWLSLNQFLAGQLNGTDALFWDVDGNGAAGPGAYPLDVTLEPTTDRLVTVRGLVQFDPVGPGLFTFQITRDGVGIGDPVSVDAAPSTDRTQVFLVHTEFVPYNPVPRYGIQGQTDQGGGADIDLFNYELRGEGRPGY